MGELDARGEWYAQRVAQVGVGVMARNGIDKEAETHGGAGSMSMTQMKLGGPSVQTDRGESDRGQQSLDGTQ